MDTVLPNEHVIQNFYSWGSKEDFCPLNIEKHQSKICVQKIQGCPAREQDEVPKNYQEKTQVSTQLLVPLWANNLTGSRQQDQGDCKFKGQGSEK